jgi:hypothetical protein
MVSFTTVTAVSVIAFVGMIEPAFAVGTALRVGASLLGSAPSSNSNNKRADTPTSDSQLESHFATCLSTVHQSPPTMVYNADKSVDMGNLPSSCMHEVEAYNNQTNIEQMEATGGRIIVNGPSSVHMDKIPADMHAELEQKLGQPGANGSKSAAKPAAQPTKSEAKSEATQEATPQAKPAN